MPRLSSVYEEPSVFLMPDGNLEFSDSIFRSEFEEPALPGPIVGYLRRGCEVDSEVDLSKISSGVKQTARRLGNKTIGHMGHISCLEVAIHRLIYIVTVMNQPIYSE